MTQPASEGAIQSKLPIYAVDSFIQWRNDGDKEWRAVALTLQRVFAEAARKNKSVPKMKLYQDAASYLGQGGSTVRNWHGIFTSVGDELLDEYDGIFTFSHWRKMVPAAKRAKKNLADYAAGVAATADNYGGLPIPPDAIVAIGSKAKTPTELVEKGIDDARASIAIVSRHINAVHPTLAEDVRRVMAAVEDLNTKFERAERTKLVQPEESNG